MIFYLSQFQNVSPPHDGGIFDSLVRQKSQIPDFERERAIISTTPKSIGIFDTHTKCISRIEI